MQTHWMWIKLTQSLCMLFCSVSSPRLTGGKGQVGAERLCMEWSSNNAMAISDLLLVDSRWWELMRSGRAPSFQTLTRGRFRKGCLGMLGYLHGLDFGRDCLHWVAQGYARTKAIIHISTWIVELVLVIGALFFLLMTQQRLWRYLYYDIIFLKLVQRNRARTCPSQSPAKKGW